MNQQSNRSTLRALWLALSGLLLFLILVLAIRNPIVQSWDNRLIIFLNPLRREPLIHFFQEFTQMASSHWLLPVIIIFLIFLLYKKRFAAALLLPAAFLVERGLNRLLKEWVMRQRPDFPHLTHEIGYSFPSGHAMNGSTIYGLLILLILPHIHAKWLRIIWVSAGLLIILLIGFSRPFLRVHYATDILAGYAMGAVIIGFSMIALNLIERKKSKK
ncbi:MAG: phosphatase PAP2 family protein [Sporolactobacillus sp.]